MNYLHSENIDDGIFLLWDVSKKMKSKNFKEEIFYANDRCE